MPGSEPGDASPAGQDASITGALLLALGGVGCADGEEVELPSKRLSHLESETAFVERAITESADPELWALLVEACLRAGIPGTMEAAGDAGGGAFWVSTVLPGSTKACGARHCALIKEEAGVWTIVEATLVLS